MDNLLVKPASNLKCTVMTLNDYIRNWLPAHSDCTIHSVALDNRNGVIVHYTESGVDYA